MPLQSSHSPSSPRMAANSQLFPHSPGGQETACGPVALCGPVDFEGAVGWMGLKRAREKKKKWAPLVSCSAPGPRARN